MQVFLSRYADNKGQSVKSFPFARRNAPHLAGVAARNPPAPAYQLAEMSRSNNSELTAVSARVPDAVICLISALSFHELTTQIPHEVYLAIPRRKESPRIDYPPVRVFRFSDQTISAGVDIHKIGGVKVKIFTAEKTVADCFKFRNRIGLDAALEGLKMCLNRNGSRAKILEYARLCRVEKVISPYLEAID
jgi:predicted transcriptional regulator of viral defense system